MTTIHEEVVTCALCRESSSVTVVTSTSSFGSPDLDLRPAEPERSSIFAWVQRCGWCGYCAPTIEEGTPYTHEIVESPSYRALLVDADLPDLARSFLCSSLIFEELEEEAWAARNAIEAAWVCDDENAREAAVRCRLLAAERLCESQTEGDALYEDPSVGCAVLVDLLRRAGHFEDAVKEADAALDYAEVEVAAVLAFSRALAFARDSGTYTVEDALSTGADDRAIVGALQQLVAYGERGDYFAKCMILRADEPRNYYVQFAVDEGGLFCEVVHNKYLAQEHSFTGDDIAKLLLLGFEAPEYEDQNLFRVFHPASEDDYAAIASLVRTVVADFFGLPRGHPLQLGTSWGLGGDQNSR